MPKLKPGSKAPSFKLEDKNGAAFSLSDFKSGLTVLYFYPKDDTPGCTIEAKEFNASLARLKKLGLKVIGISGGDNRSKTNFCKKYGLKIPLLSDTDFSVAKSYGAYGKKKFMGREYNGIFRKTFLIGADQKIVHIFDEVKPKGHVKQILEVIRSADLMGDSKTKEKKTRPAARRQK